MRQSANKSCKGHGDSGQCGMASEVEISDSSKPFSRLCNTNNRNTTARSSIQNSETSFDAGPSFINSFRIPL